MAYGELNGHVILKGQTREPWPQYA